jgi:G3E family GTPase
VKDIRKTVNPDFLFAEPSEMVTTDEIRGAASMGLRDVHYDLGPVITLVDGEGFEDSWAERSMLIKSQIKGADMVALSRADLLEETERDEICVKLREYSGNVIELSVNNGLGLEEVVALID